MLLELVLDGDETVALHAVAAIDDLTNDTQSALIEWLQGADEKRGDIAAHLLSRHQRIDPLFDACERGGRARVRALSALGGLPR